MFNVEDILARLNDGDTIEDIAAEMTEALNEANTAYTAAKETEDRKAALETAGRNLVHSLLEYINLVYPEALKNVTEEDVNEFICLLVEEADALKDIAAMCMAFNDMKIAFAQPSETCKSGCACKKSISKEAEKTAEEILAEFLKKNFLS